MLIRVRCCVSHPLSFSRVWRLPSVWPSSLQLFCVQLRPQIVASLVPQNSKAVKSAPDQTATFPERLLVRLLAVLWEGVGVGVVGVLLALYLHTLCGFL